MSAVALAAVAVLLFVFGFFLFLRWGTNWGSTAAERDADMPGDRYLEPEAAVRVVMTRGITIDAEPDVVWPWLAQLGRGAGWYSFDRLDNGGKVSAEHVVSWIPDPEVGDASPIGYLRRIDPGRSLVWWVEGVRFGGAMARLVVDILLKPRNRSSRLLIRVSADAEGMTAPLALLAFRFIDSMMARRQLLGLRERAERYRARSVDPERPETGARDQYQLYEAIYASGERAGKRDSEHAARWRRRALEDGVISGVRLGGQDDVDRIAEAVHSVRP